MERLILSAFATVAILNFANGESLLLLDPNYTAKYFVDSDNNVHFVAVMKTSVPVWIGLGINTEALMDGADIVTAGFNGSKHDEIYVEDRHGTGNVIPPLDIHQDWKSIPSDTHMNATHMQLHLVRKIHTDDPQANEDKVISNGSMFLIWAYGQSNKFEFHGKNKGFMKVDFLSGGSTTIKPSPSPSPKSTTTVGPSTPSSPSTTEPTTAGADTLLFINLSSLCFFNFIYLFLAHLLVR